MEAHKVLLGKSTVRLNRRCGMVSWAQHVEQVEVLCQKHAATGPTGPGHRAFCISKPSRDADEPSHNCSCSKTAEAAYAFTQSIGVPVALGRWKQVLGSTRKGCPRVGWMSKDRPDFSGVTNPCRARLTGRGDAPSLQTSGTTLGFLIIKIHACSSDGNNFGAR